jgi:uracil-DNA glycosylase
MATRGKKNSDTPQLPLLTGSLKTIAEEAKHCRNCDLWKHATQTVFGEGSPRASIMFVGEQPGNQEDLQDRPFVGPAGKLLKRTLKEVGIDLKKIYVTNAVKHFKWEPRAKRRIHKKPNATEIAACRPWLDAELAAVKPKLVVCLGATAAQALLGRTFRLTQHRGKLLESSIAPHVMATVHPSSILRALDEATRHEAQAQFLADLKKIAKLKL